MTPTVSIILPTFNRARFLPQAIESIRTQQFSDWELIVVDDGSTDETPQLIRDLMADISQPVELIHQENQGPYAARNTGLDHVRGEYVAFFDSDDIWLPHHLRDCVAALETNPDVEWVYGACRVVDNDAGTVISASTFYVDGMPRPFMSLASRNSGTLHIIDDPRRLEWMIRYGYFCGLQNSLIRTSTFATNRFQVAHRHEGEDRIFALKTAANGGRFAYFDNVHVIYNVHGQNSSGSSSTADPQKTYDILRSLVNARRELLQNLPLTRRERAALRYRISSEEFWGIGYTTYWQRGFRAQAFSSYIAAIRMYPWIASYWKTLFACLLRAGMGLGPV